MPWDQITHTVAVSMAATPVAQRCMGFKGPRAQKNEGVSRHTWFSHGCIRTGSDIQLMTVGTVEVGHPSAWCPPDSACWVVAIGLGLWSRHGRRSHLVSHGFSREGGSTTTTEKIGETGRAELRPPNSASRGRHHTEV